MAAKIARDHLMLGLLGEIQPGDEIPATYPAPDGSDAKTDFARLERLGLIGEPDSDKPADAPAKPKRSSKPADAPAE